MSLERGFLVELEGAVAAGYGWNDLLARVLECFDADSGTIHVLGGDGVLHLEAASDGIPQVVLDTVRDVPVGKGMAGLAVERKAPVNSCNIQTDVTGDVRPGARATGLLGSLVVPILKGEAAIGALGIANHRERTFTDEEAGLLLDVGRVLGRRRTN
jgi:L-methionine (R)-S-oxide reductase